VRALARARPRSAITINYRKNLRTERGTALKNYLRSGLQTAARRHERRTTRKAFPKFIQIIVDHADKMSSTRYLIQLPFGEFNTGSILQSPAEKEYKRAMLTSRNYGDIASMSGVAIHASNRFLAEGRLDTAFRFGEMSGDVKELEKIGAIIAREHARLADSYQNNLIMNELGIGKFRKGVDVAVRSWNGKLAKEIVATAVKRYEAYGDMCVKELFSSIHGLEFGYARALKWVRDIKDYDVEKRLTKKVVELYANNPLINSVSLLAVEALGDQEQAELIRMILKGRKGS